MSIHEPAAQSTAGHTAARRIVNTVTAIAWPSVPSVGADSAVPMDRIRLRSRCRTARSAASTSTVRIPAGHRDFASIPTLRPIRTHSAGLKSHASALTASLKSLNRNGFVL